VDNAEIAEAPVSPNAVRNYGLGILLGLLLGVGLAVVRELLDTSVATAEDVAEVTSSPILGHINADPAAVKKDSALALGEATPWAESFRVLRTNMQYVEVDHDHRVFVISSSLPAEGKSTTAVNLAVTLAMAGEKVALVECDLRRPTMGQRLGLDDAVGTTSVLIGKVSLEDALQTYKETGLAVLTSGPRPPNPSELLQSHAMELLVKELREQFDVVLLDAPPLLPVTDAALLAAQADGLLAVVRHGKTTRDQLRHALERVESVGAKCVGIVVNLAPSRKSSRGYGYGYAYAYDYAPRNDTKSRRKGQGGS
jgi:capsular exopolysaccharide synthesis family protein